jgi:hypothetical protein
MHDLDRIREAARHYDSGVSDPDRAEATARAALRACRDALDILVARLRDEGFPTSIPGRIAVDQLDVERAVALLPRRPPRVLQLFWEEVGAFRLVDSRRYSDAEYAHAEYFDSRGMVGGSPDGTTDALWVDGPEPDWMSFLSDDLDRWRAGPTEPFLVPLSPDHLHKDGISGGGPYGIELGDDDWRPIFGGDFAWIGHRRPESVGPELATDFVSYLRASILECAGFPGLYGSEEFEPLRRRLVADLPVF